MGRALLVLETQADRQKAVNWIGKAPEGTRVEFKASKRSLPQNDLMWALLTEFSQKFQHNGKKYDPTEWKCIFLHAFGREISFLPSLDGRTFLPIEMSSSDLSKQEMTDFIEFILKEAADRGIVLQMPKDTNSEATPPASDTADVALPSTSALAGEFSPSSSANNSIEEEYLAKDFTSKAGGVGERNAPADNSENGVLIRFARDVLSMAANPNVSVAALSAAEKRWGAAEISKLSETGIEKARAISASMRAVANDPARLDGVLEHYADFLETTVEHLRG